MSVLIPLLLVVAGAMLLDWFVIEIMSKAEHIEEEESFHE